MSQGNSSKFPSMPQMPKSGPRLYRVTNGEGKVIRISSQRHDARRLFHARLGYSVEIIDDAGSDNFSDDAVTLASAEDLAGVDDGE